MFAAVTSVALVGVEPVPVRVEVHVGGGKQIFSLVGLPDTAIREAKERVRSAILSSGFHFPTRRVTVNLAPADIPKAGSAYDLPIALGVLAAHGSIPAGASRVVALGELALDGRLRKPRGSLGAAMVASDAGVPCVVPSAAVGEASIAPGADIRGAANLAEAVGVALGEIPPSAGPAADAAPCHDRVADLSAVRGQMLARRALEIAAAGGHHLLLSGPPGAGKTMLARCLPGIMPPLSDRHALEAAQAWAAAGRMREDLHRPPFRNPHHTATPAAVIGGGSGVPVPGELTLGHRGVVFLDELGEVAPHLLDALRQPIEEGAVVVARKGAAVRFPCAVQVVAATNPCPCGFAGDRLTPCRCGRGAVERYRRRLSGPLLDRFDMRVVVERLSPDEMAGSGGEDSEAVRCRVVVARARQDDRGVLNRDLGREGLDGLPSSAAADALLRSAAVGLALTVRGWDRVRRVARSIADLGGEDGVGEAHVAEALALRIAP